MIISASRRTDIPAFYAEWIVNRIRAGFCAVPNPFNRHQVSRVSLRPEDVDVIVFWTRNPRPLMAHLGELDSRGLRYYFQFTILGYPRELDPKSPSIAAAVEAFKALSDRLGPCRVIWRYDPLIFTSLTTADFHRDNYGRLAEALRGYTRRSVVSVVDRYRKAERRLKGLDRTPAAVETWEPEEMGVLLRDLAWLAAADGMEIVSCAEETDLTPCGIRPGKCVDDQVIEEAFGTQVNRKKDPTQRAACGCVVSRDIGMYDSCLFGCRYCYATQSFERARVNFDQHDPTAPSLVGRYEATAEPPGQRTCGTNDC
jgi:DNA repair photolyase